MEQNSSNGFDFEVVGSKKDLEEIIRDSFRMPVGESDDIAVVIDGQSFDVINISNTGIGIRVEDPGNFSVSDVLDGSEIHIQGKTINPKLEICHISPQVQGGYICGIRFINLKNEGYNLISDFIQRKGKELFKRD